MQSGPTANQRGYVVTSHSRLVRRQSRQTLSAWYNKWQMIISVKVAQIVGGKDEHKPKTGILHFYNGGFP